MKIYRMLDCAADWWLGTSGYKNATGQINRRGTGPKSRALVDPVSNIVNLFRKAKGIRGLVTSLLLALRRGVGESRQCAGSMIKSELVECVMHSYPGLYHRDAEIAVDAVLEAIVKALARGDRVELRGFGAFSAKERRSRVGRNPRSGQSVPVSAKRVPMFKASKEIRQVLNPAPAPNLASSGTSP